MFAIGVLASFLLMMYVIARKDSLKFFIQIGGALMIATLFYYLGLSDEMAYIGVGLTLSLVYYMR